MQAGRESVVLAMAGRYGSAAYVMIIVSVAVAIVLIMLRSSDYYSNDAAQYWSVINNLLAGAGLKTSAVYYEVQAQHGMPAYQTVWPPGLPLLATGLAWLTGVGNVAAVATLNAFGHALAAWLIYWIVAKLRGSEWVGAGAGLVYLFYGPALSYSVAGVSEPLFIVSSVGSLAAVVKALVEEGSEGEIRWLVVAAVLVGVGSWFRYQTIFHIMPLGLLCIYIYQPKFGLFGSVLRSVLMCLPGAVLFGILVVRNLVVAGNITGGGTSAHGNSLVDLAFQAKWAVLGLLGVMDGATKWLAVCLVLVLAGVAGIALWYRIQVLSERRRAHIGVAIYAFGSAVIISGLILVLALRSTFYSLDGRYFLTAGLFFIIGAIALWRQLPSDRVGERWFAGALGAAGLVTAFLVVAQVGAFSRSLSTGGTSVAIREALAAPYLDGSVASFLRARGSLASPVMSNQSQLLHLVLERPTFSVPEKRLTPVVWKPQDIVGQARRFGVRYIVIFRKMPLGSLDGNTDYVWQLMNQTLQGLEVLVSTDDLVLYRLGDGA